MIIKKTITIALLVLMGLSSTDAMQVACRNFGRGYPPFVRNHSDVRPDLREPIRQFNLLHEKANNVIITCVQGMEITKDPLLIGYGWTYVGYAQLVQLYLNPQTLTPTDLSTGASNIRQLKHEMMNTEANFQDRLSLLKRYPNYLTPINFEDPSFIEALGSIEDLTETLIKTPLSIFSSAGSPEKE